MSSGRNRYVLLLFLVALLMGSLAAYACGGGDSEEEATPTQVAGTPKAKGASVEIKGFAFDPKTVTIKVGQTVTWTNQDSTPHTIRGDDFESGNLSKGETFSKTFDGEGAYDYDCSLHPSMKGQVIVEK